MDIAQLNPYFYNDQNNQSAFNVREEFDLPASHMTLLSHAASDCARRAVKLLASAVRGNAKKPSRIYITAMEAIIGDLLLALSFQPPRPCFRPLSAGSFTGGVIGYKAFIAVFNDLLRKDFVFVVKGRAAFGGVDGRVSRIRATVRLTDYLHQFGICAENRSTHFSSHQKSRTSTEHAYVICKTSSKRTKGTKIPGIKMEIDWSNKHVITLNEQLVYVNRALSNFALSHQTLPAEGLFDELYRIFNLGDDPGFNWNKGGRIYASGASFQSLSEDQRRDLLIDGEATSEIDISGCHITILHGLLKTPLPRRNDLYDGSDVPRDIMKDYVNLSIGSGRFPYRWTPDHKQKHGADLQERFPIGSMKDKAISLFPVLRKWEGKGISWADLQYVDSVIVMDAVETLAKKYNVPAYPVHDSIIVPVSKIATAEKQLGESFFKFVGLKPNLKLK